MGRIIPIDEVIAQESRGSSGRRVTPIDEVIRRESPVGRTEARIAQRESLLPTAQRTQAGFLTSLLSPRRNVQRFINPLGAAQEVAQVGGAQLGAGQELLESLTASPFVSAKAQRPIGRDLLSVLKGERVVERGDILRQHGAPEPVAALFGLATSPEVVIPGVMGARAGVRGLTSFVRKLRTPTQITDAQLLAMPEEALVRLPSELRSRYFSLQDDIITASTSREGAEFKRLATKASQFRQAREATAESRVLPSARQDIKRLETLYPKVREEQTAKYTTMMREAIAKNPNVMLTPQELKLQLAEKFLEHEPITYRALVNTLDDSLARAPFGKQESLSPLELVDRIDDLGSTVSRATRGKLRAPTREEFITDKLRYALMDTLEAKGVNVKLPKKFWATEWVPQRDVALQLQRPSGPGLLKRITAGKEVVRQEHFEQLEALAGERLDRGTRQAFDQLSYLNQQKVLAQTKQLERQRLTEETSRFAKGSLAERKSLVDQRARHRESVRKLVYQLALYGSGAVGIGATFLRGAKTASQFPPP